MKSQVKNVGQPAASNDSKKSVFDRLGSQAGSSRQQPSRSSNQFTSRGSPYPSFDHLPHGNPLSPPPPPQMHRHREVPAPLAPPPPHLLPPDVADWHYMQQHSDRRHQAYSSRDHQHSLIPPPQTQMPYDNIGRAPSYYNPHFHHSHHHSPPVHGLPPPPLPAPLMHIPSPGPGGIVQLRSSLKYDRHGNLIVGIREGGRHSGEHHLGPPAYPELYAVNSRIDLMRPSSEMAPPPARWHENIDINPHSDSPYSSSRSMNRYSPATLRKFFPPQQQQPSNSNSETSRYARWRERRHAITTLDKETARSSSRTNSLKSSLQLIDSRGTSRSTPKSSESELLKISSGTNQAPKSNEKSGQSKQKAKEKEGSAPKRSTDEGVDKADISDGEIVDDSSDEVDSSNLTFATPNQSNVSTSYKRNSSIYEQNVFDHRRKRMRRYVSGENGVTDFENISDEEFDDFMNDKETNACDEAESGSLNSGEASACSKSASEIELLNAIGLDWANLVEMAKQSKCKDIVPQTSSARLRFSLPSYLPSLNISPELAGPELYEILSKLCRS